MTKQIVGGALPGDPADGAGAVVAERNVKRPVQACNLVFTDHLRRWIAQIWLEVRGAKNPTDRVRALDRP
ncbi:MAG: hypothetical protein WCB02_01040 [Bradyrhizobium sp.]